VKFREITAERTGETSAQIVNARHRPARSRNGLPRKRQRHLQRPDGHPELKAFCALDEATLELLQDGDERTEAQRPRLRTGF